MDKMPRRLCKRAADRTSLFDGTRVLLYMQDFESAEKRGIALTVGGGREVGNGCCIAGVWEGRLGTGGVQR